jgi:outer membrane protein assembly factor BamB
LNYQWHFRTGNAIISSPVVADGKVYIGNRAGKIYCFGAFTGEKIWEYQTAGWVDSSPCSYEGVVYIGSRDGKLYAIDASTPVVKWTYSAGGMICSSPIVYDGYIYFAVGYPEKKVVCLTINGQFKWSFNTGQYAYSSPAVKNGKVYVGANDGKFYCLDAYTGEEKWSSKTDGLIYFVAMTVTEDTVYATPGEGDLKVYAFNSQTGVIKWSKNLGLSGFSAVSSIVYSEGKLYLGAGMRPHYIFCLNAANGNILWKESVGNASVSGICSSPALANNVLYIGSAEEGDLYALDALTGKFLGIERYEVEISSGIDLGSEIVGSPAVSNGWVYIGTTEGILYAYKASEIVSISSPDDGESVSGEIKIKSYIENSLNSNQYELSYGLGTNPNSWMKISAGMVGQLQDGLLMNWETTQLPMGNYTLKLTVNNSKTAKVSFSVGQPYSGTTFETYVWPNPAYTSKGELPHITYKIPGSGNVNFKIKIYNVAGELVRAIERNVEKGREYKDGDALIWDLKNDDGEMVASGVYIYIVYVDGKPEKGKIKKIAVIK